MMKIINKLTFKYMKLNKVRTLVMMFGIILVGAMISGVFTLIASFHDLLIREQIKATGNYYAVLPEVAGSKLDIIKAEPEIKTISLAANLGFAELPENINPVKPYFYIVGYDQNNFKSISLPLIKGRLPEREDEILFSNYYLSELNQDLKLGTEITLAIGMRTLKEEPLTLKSAYQEGETLTNVQTKTYTVVGIIDEITSGGNNFPGYTMITYFDSKKSDPNLTYTVSLLTENPKQIYEITEDLATKLDVEIVKYNDNLLMMLGVNRGNHNGKKLLYMVGSILAVVIMVGSIGVINNGFNISLTERKKQYGILMSIGATRNQILLNVLFEVFLLVIVAIPLGLIAGIGGIGITLKFVNYLLADLNDLSLQIIISPLAIGLSFLFIILTILISVLIPALKTAKTPPLQAIRMSSDVKVKKKQVKTSRLSRFLFGIEGVIALKNMKRNRRKYRTTIFSLFISIVLFFTIHSFIKLGFRSTNMYFDDQQGDIFVNLPAATEPKTAQQIIQKIVKLPKIDEVAIPEGIPVIIMAPKKQLLYLVTYDEAYLNKYLKQHNQKIKLNKNNEVILMNTGKKIEEDKAKKKRLIEYNYFPAQKGMKLDLYNITSNDKMGTVVIKEITTKIPLGNSSGIPLAITSEHVFNKFKQQYEQFKDYSIIINSKQHQQVTTLIQEIITKYNYEGVAVYNNAEMLEQERKALIVISIFLYGFLSLITLIGITNIFNTITTSLFLRSKEFAVLKSMGLTNKGFNRILYYESIFYCLKALLYGLPVGLLINYFLINSFDEVFEMAHKLPLNTILITISGLVIIVFSTMFYSSRQLKKVNIITAIRTENI